MPGPTTEVLNDDVKELKADLRDIRSSLDTLRADVHAIAMGVAELKAEFRITAGIAKWAGTLLVATLLTGGVSAIWWASTITSDLKRLSAELTEGRKSGEATRSLSPVPAPTK